MSRETQKSAFIPILLIAAGAGWLLKLQGMAPSLRGIMAAFLALCAIIYLLSGGFNKESVVLAPMLLYVAACLGLPLFQAFSLSFEIAAGMVLLGVLMLLARLDAVPAMGGKPARRPVRDSGRPPPPVRPDGRDGGSGGSGGSDGSGGSAGGDRGDSFS